MPGSPISGALLAAKAVGSPAAGSRVCAPLQEQLLFSIMSETIPAVLRCSRGLVRCGGRAGCLRCIRGGMRPHKPAAVLHARAAGRRAPPALSTERRKAGPGEDQEEMQSIARVVTCRIVTLRIVRMRSPAELENQLVSLELIFTGFQHESPTGVTTGVEILGFSDCQLSSSRLRS